MVHVILNKKHFMMMMVKGKLFKMYKVMRNYTLCTCWIFKISTCSMPYVIHNLPGMTDHRATAAVQSLHTFCSSCVCHTADVLLSRSSADRRHSFQACILTPCDAKHVVYRECVPF